MGINAELSDLTSATAPAGGELIYIVQGGNSRKLALGKTGAALLDDTGQTDALSTLGVSSLMQGLLNDTGQTTAQTTLGGGTAGKTIFTSGTQLAVREYLGLGVGPLKTPHIHPMMIDYDRHYGFNTCLFTRTDGGLTVVTRQAIQHNNDDDAEIIAWETYDKGLSRINIRTAYAGTTTDDRNFASAVMGSRFGIVAMRNSAGTATTPMFLYSDDQGVTWSAIAFTLDAGLPANYASSPHGKIMPWPASAGGNDTTGWIVYFYSQEVIAYATTTDNGDTWSNVLTAITGTGQAPTEMAVARVGSEDKWFMIIRKEVAGSNALVSTSTNMTTWADLSASGIELSKNPPYLVQDDDATWLYATNRRANGITGLPINSVIVSKITASTFYDTLGISGFSDWSVVAQLPQWGTGYLDFIEYNDEWIAAFNAGEQPFEGSTNGGGANALYLLSNTPSAQGLALLYGSAQHHSSLLNSGFQVWQNGTSGTGVAGRVMTADGWGLRRTGSATGHEWSRQAGSNGGYALRVQRTAANTSTAVINLINVINSDDIRTLRGRHCSVTIRAKKGADFSAASNTLNFNVYGNTTESQITATDGTAPSSTALRTFSMTLDSNNRWTEYDTTFFVTDDLEMVWLRVHFTPVGTAGAADYIELEQIRIVPTPYKQQFKPRPYGEELALCQRYFCKTYASSVNAGTVTAQGALQNNASVSDTGFGVNMDWRYPIEMRAVPTIVTYSPVTGDTGKLANTISAADLSGTAATIGRTGATLTNGAPATVTNTYRAHAVASALPW